MDVIFVAVIDESNLASIIGGGHDGGAIKRGVVILAVLPLG